MLWFMDAKLQKQDYEDQFTFFDHRTIIEADSYEQAIEKYEAYWLSRSEDYVTYYTVLDYTLNKGL